MAEVAQASALFPDFGLPQGNEHMDLSREGEAGDEGAADHGNSQQLPGTTDDIFDYEHMEDLFGESHTDLHIPPPVKGKNTPEYQSTADPTKNVNGENVTEPGQNRKQHLPSLFGNPTDGLSKLKEISNQSLGTDTDILDRQCRDDNRHAEFAQPNFERGASPGPTHADDTEGLSPVFSQKDTYIGRNETDPTVEDPVESYGLRRNINRLGAASTHIDVDQSGNYDPTEEARTLKTRATKRTKQAQRSKGESAGIAKRRGRTKTSSKPSNEPIFKQIVRLQIRAMGSVLNITDGKDNWPEDHSLIGSDEEAERLELLSFYRRRASDSPDSVQTPVHDPAGEKKDLTGHPEARGCKECRLQSVYCSMVSDGHYPCTICQENSIDCHPIIKPKVTGRCERCEHHGISCSLEGTESIHSSKSNSMCDECLEADSMNCKPSRPKEYGNKRIDLDKTLYCADRKYQDCTHCREQKRKCSLKKPSDKPPCTRCKKAKIGCHFYDVATPINTVSRKTKRRRNGEERITHANAAQSIPTLTERVAPDVVIPDSQFFSAEDIAYMKGETPAAADEDDGSAQEDVSNLEMMEDIEGHQGFMTKIRTSFAHPMIFSTNPDDYGNTLIRCSFCDMGIFGMVGHFEREVHVIEWSNGLGYTEMGNGHREGNDQTVMCPTCTCHRLQVVACSSHVMKEIRSETPVDKDSASDELIDAPSGSLDMQFQLQRWCSMCFSLAAQMCCTLQPSIVSNGEDEYQAIKEGCGLRLCQECARKFDEEYKRDLNAMAAAFEKEPKLAVDEENGETEGEGENGQGIVRADVGLLRNDGLLMRCVTDSMDD